MSRLNEIGNRAGVRVEEAHMARTEGRRLRQIIAQQSKSETFFPLQK